MNIRDRKIKSIPVAHRTAISAADTTADISDSTGAFKLTDQIHVACVLECSAANVTATVLLALWDESDNFIGITSGHAFVSDSLYTNGAGGSYVTPIYIYDTIGAAKVKAIVKSLSGGEIDKLYLIPLSLD